MKANQETISMGGTALRREKRQVQVVVAGGTFTVN